MKHQREAKKDKILQFGERVFGIKDGSDEQRIDATIQQVIDFFHKMEVPASLPEADLSSDDDIDAIVQQLKTHKLEKLGEHGAIGLDQSREILQLAV